MSKRSGWTCLKRCRQAFTLDYQTRDELTGVYLLFAGRDAAFETMIVDQFKVRTVVPAGRIDSWRLERDGIQDKLSSFFTLVRENPEVPVRFKDGSGLFRIPVDIPHLSSPACICGEGSIHISCDLTRVTPCVFMRDVSAYNLGEVRSGRNHLREIWRSPIIKRFSEANASAETCASHTIAHGSNAVT